MGRPGAQAGQGERVTDPAGGVRPPAFGATMTPNVVEAIAAELRQMDEPALALAYAALAAMRQDPAGAEVRALVLTFDAGPLVDWLRAHGWLAADSTLGPVARFAMGRSDPGQAAVDADVEARCGWMLDMFMPDRVQPARLS